MRIYMQIKASEAIKAGKSRSGVCSVELDDLAIASMTPEQRAALATYATDATDASRVPVLGSSAAEMGVAGPIEPTIAEALSYLERYAAEKAVREAKAAVEREKIAVAREKAIVDGVEIVLAHGAKKVGTLLANRGYGATLRGTVYNHDLATPPGTPTTEDLAHAVFSRLPPEWVAECEAEAEAERLLAAKMREERYAEDKAAAEKRAAKDAEAQKVAEEKKAALRAYLLSHPDPLVRERAAEGLVSEEEGLRLVREEVFSPCANLSRYERLCAEDTVHASECNDLSSAVRYTVETAEHCDANTYAALKTVRAAAEKIDGAEVEMRLHTVHCDGCNESMERFSALVSVTWHGWDLSREYAL